MDGKLVSMVSLQEPSPWRVHVDDAANQRVSGVGLVISSPEKIIVRSLFQSADYIRMIAKWGMILGAFNIKYMPCTFVKGQVLANLVAKFVETLFEEKVMK